MFRLLLRIPAFILGFLGWLFFPERPHAAPVPPPPEPDPDAPSANRRKMDTKFPMPVQRSSGCSSWVCSS